MLRTTDHSIPLHPSKGDAILFNYRITHRGHLDKAGKTSYRHRSLFTLAYGRKNERSEDFARALIMRDMLWYPHAVYPCDQRYPAHRINETCAQEVGVRHARNQIGAGIDTGSDTSGHQSALAAELRACRQECVSEILQAR